MSYFLLPVSNVSRVSRSRMDPREWIPAMSHLIGRGISLLPYGQLSADDALSLCFRLVHLGLTFFLCSCVR